MGKRNLINQAVRYAVATGTLITAVGYIPTASAANANSPAQLGKVTVTGTRIKRTNIETAQPITRISRQQIESSGYTSLGQLLGRLSFAGTHGSVTNGYTSGTTSAVNLRNLGYNRNLVLVNGKRWFQGLGGRTNLSTIPTSLIDHIEILQDGASAVYGSDAISGVVNIITVKNFNGAAAHAYYGIRNDHQTGNWDGQIKQYDFTVGSGNNRGNVVFNATYRKANGISRARRKITQTPYAGEPGYVGGNSGTPRGRFQLFGPAVSGRTFGQATCGAYDPKDPEKTLCDLTLRNAPAMPSLQNFRSFKETDLNNNSPHHPLTQQGKRVSVYVQGHYDLFDNITFTANAAYVRREPSFKADFPGPFVIGATSTKTANGQPNGDPISIAASNPYNPFSAALVSDTTDPCLAAGSCIGLRTLRRLGTPPHVASKFIRRDQDYFHIFAGFNGFVNLFNREIDWDVGFAQNRLQGTTITEGDYNLAHVLRALGPASQCTAPCVPLNFFGGSTLNGGESESITQAQGNYIDVESHRITQSNLRDWTANLSSDIYNLPAGPLGVAVGYERVDNYGYIHPDAVQVEQNFDAIHLNGPLTNGRVVRNAEYAELNIPLLADLPGVKNLSLDIANRWTQFKIEGNTGAQHQESFNHNSSGRFNIRWQATNDLLLRASWSQGFRSPAVSELFGGQRGEFTKITDPCAPPPNGGYTGGPLPENCPGGTSDVQTSPKLNGQTGSNPNLGPEKSISRTVGFVYSPRHVPGLDINADYFKIELNNAIETVGTQNIISSCFNSSSLCNLVGVQGNQITSVLNLNTNIGSLLTEGIDFGVHYKFPSTPVGDFNLRINGTFLKTFDKTSINESTQSGFATSHLAGVSEHPRRRFNGYLDWDYGNWSARYRIEYFGSVVDRCTVPIEGYCSSPKKMSDFQGAPGVFSLGRQRLGATVYHDIHLAYTVPAINTTFGLGVNNLFDKKPPINGSGTFDKSIYRLPSRLVYGSIRVRF